MGPIAIPERPLWTAVERCLRPRLAPRPSEWVAQHIILDGRQTPRPGPFDVNFKPWTRACLDAHFEEPHKKGVITIKPSQVGHTFISMGLLLYLAANKGGPGIYFMDTESKALDYSHAFFTRWIRASPTLQETFTAGKDDRTILGHYEYPGGVLDFAGAGTESDAISRSRRYVFIDEFEMSSRAFPTASGDLFATALQRTEVYQHSGRIDAFGHPRFFNEDIHALYMARSDRREWVFDCPHCAKALAPRWEHVHFSAIEESRTGLEAPRLDPASAVLRCPHCSREISDAQRARATWPADRGGSGRFESSLDVHEAAAREWIGLAIHRLADPETPLIKLAREWAIVRGNTGAEQTFMNKGLGEPYRAASGLVTFATVAERVKTQDRILLPGGEHGVYYLTAGVDVQAPEDNPVLVTSVEAWAASGQCFTVALEAVRGWAALFEFLRTTGFALANDSGQDSGQRLGISAVGIDCGNWTGRVLDNARTTVVSAASGAIIPIIPVRYQPHVKSTLPAVLWKAEKRLNKLRPDLGMLEAYDLHRHTWVDRRLRRWMDGRVTVLCRAPADLAAQITANTLVPIKTPYGHSEELQWELIKDRRDDWMQAGAYAEAAAALKLGLDRLHLLASAPASGGANSGNTSSATAGGWMAPRGSDWLSRSGTGRSWWG